MPTPRTTITVDVRLPVCTYATVLIGLLAANQPIRNLGTVTRAAIEIAAERFVQKGIISPVEDVAEAFAIVQNLTTCKQGDVCSPSLLEMLCKDEVSTEAEAETETEQEN